MKRIKYIIFPVLITLVILGSGYEYLFNKIQHNTTGSVALPTIVIKDNQQECKESEQKDCFKCPTALKEQPCRSVSNTRLAEKKIVLSQEDRNISLNLLQECLSPNPSENILLHSWELSLKDSSGRDSVIKGSHSTFWTRRADGTWKIKAESNTSSLSKVKV